jgi:hypothetical protein
MASIYARGSALWCRYKNAAGKWASKNTPFTVGEERKAERYAELGQKEIDDAKLVATGGLADKES